MSTYLLALTLSDFTSKSIPAGTYMHVCCFHLYLRYFSADFFLSFVFLHFTNYYYDVFPRYMLIERLLLLAMLTMQLK